MIFVTLGNQNFQFARLLEKIEELIRTQKIREEVRAQIGHTRFESNFMHTCDFLSKKEFNTYIEEASFVITHAGSGSLITSLRKDKRVIAVARLKKYNEHIDNHQQEILEAFSNRKLILGVRHDLSDMESRLEAIEKFKPGKFVSNNMVFNESLMEIISEL